MRAGVPHQLRHAARRPAAAGPALLPARRRGVGVPAGLARRRPAAARFLSVEAAAVGLQPAAGGPGSVQTVVLAYQEPDPQGHATGRYINQPDKGDVVDVLKPQEVLMHDGRALDRPATLEEMVCAQRARHPRWSGA